MSKRVVFLNSMMYIQVARQKQETGMVAFFGLLWVLQFFSAGNKEVMYMKLAIYIIAILLLGIKVSLMVLILASYIKTKK